MVRRRKELKPRTPSSLKRYGLTVDQWREMLEKGGGRCWICGKGGLTKHLSIDHDHTLEKLGVMVARGLLCQRCNRALGCFEWSDEVLTRAVEYMNRISLTRAEVTAKVARDKDTTAHSGGNQEGA